MVVSGCVAVPTLKMTEQAFNPVWFNVLTLVATGQVDHPAPALYRVGDRVSPQQTLDVSSIWLSDTSFISAEAVCVCVFVQQVTVSSQDMGQKRGSIDQLTFSLCVLSALMC